jgi:hypothetical protein
VDKKKSIVPLKVGKRKVPNTMITRALIHDMAADGKIVIHDFDWRDVASSIVKAIEPIRKRELSEEVLGSRERRTTPEEMTRLFQPLRRLNADGTFVMLLPDKSKVEGPRYGVKEVEAGSVEDKRLRKLLNRTKLLERQLLENRIYKRLESDGKGT